MIFAYLPFILIGFLMVHVIKMMRMYLIVMDKKISFERFVPAYFRTTLVNLIIPYKLGEIYRVFVFYRISQGFKTGFFSVLTDRFFDTFAIVLILLPYQVLSMGKVTIPVMLLALFLVVVVFAYLITPSTYGFLNRYIITSRTSKRSMAILKAIEAVHDWYEYVRTLVAGRYGILILLSMGAWLLEFLVLMGFSRFMGEGFKVSDFGAYIESIVSGSSYHLKTQYTICSVIVILVATIISLMWYLIGKKINNKEHK